MSEQLRSKPQWLDKEQLKNALLFLDELRESGITNMFGARPYVQEWWHDEYGGALESEKASEVLLYWMRTFSERHGRAQS